MLEKFSHIPLIQRITFISTFFCGLLIHATAIFNKLSFGDDILSIFGVGATYTSGRWGLALLSEIIMYLFGDNHYSLPVFNGIISLLLISFSATLVVIILNIRKIELAMLVGILMVCFPVITCLFGYMYTLPYYMASIVCGTLGVYLICLKHKIYCQSCGIVLITFSIGIYQAFIPYILSLSLMYLIGYIISNENNLHDFIKKCFEVFLCEFFAIALYFIVNKFFMCYKNFALTSYRYINTMYDTSLMQYWHRIDIPYLKFFNPSANDGYYMYFANINIIYYISIILIIFLLATKVSTLIKINKAKVFLLLLMLILFPLLTNFIFVMVPQDAVHSLMVYSQVNIFILLILLMDKCNLYYKCIYYIGNGLMILLCVMYFRFSNICYLKATILQQQAISYFTTLVTQIKSLEGYSPEFPVSFINPHNIRDISVFKIKEFDYFNIYPYFGIESYLNVHSWFKFMNLWCGYKPVVADSYKFYDNYDVIHMPSYPRSGSIKIVDNTIVVKF